MTTTRYAAGRRAWIQAQADVLVRMRGMSPRNALAKARELFEKFAKLDARRPRD